MNHGEDFAAAFGRLEANRLDLRNKIDVRPAKAGAISQPLTTIKPNQNQAAPVALSDLHDCSHLLLRKRAFALRFVLQRFDRQARIHADEARSEEHTSELQSHV